MILLAVPGILLLLRDLGRPSRDAVLETVGRYEGAVEKASVRFRIDPDLICAVIAVESRGDPEARSKAGALGLMQLMPPTGHEWAGRIGIGVIEDAQLLDPETNILIGTAYLKHQIAGFDDDLTLALAAYNAGPGNVRKWLRMDLNAESDEILRRHGFPATRAYVRNVLGYLEHLKSSHHPLPEE